MQCFGQCLPITYVLLRYASKERNFNTFELTLMLLSVDRSVG